MSDGPPEGSRMNPHHDGEPVVTVGHVHLSNLQQQPVARLHREVNLQHTHRHTHTTQQQQRERLDATR